MEDIHRRLVEIDFRGLGADASVLVAQSSGIVLVVIAHKQRRQHIASSVVSSVPDDVSIRVDVNVIDRHERDSPRSTVGNVFAREIVRERRIREYFVGEIFLDGRR